MKQSLRKAHGSIWKGMIIVIPLIIIAAIFVRQDASQLEQPVQIAPPANTGSGS
ncbi:MAG: hypothetical protein HRU27_15410 [Rhizobiaceae bacterium]|nr:hypothetical protein [Hyphomicrobiales bacterium]NRB31977.1 hypothetical protein [Rhizobiaceae bacterium]